ncbi:MAG TPA: nucleotidyltransferase domain-containing protein [Candidatus Nanoarchaeia archaeon]|nr:nucleotidyltransferase domain-containing protein [Candidatus Nanoarchaeia archaeon]
MEIYQEELKIIDFFRNHLFSELTLRELMKEIGKKSYPWTYNAVAKLGKDILITEKRGSTILAKLNLDSSTAITYLTFLDKKEAYQKKIPLVDKIIKSCSKLTPFFILMVVGSYAQGKMRESSDVDLVIITEKKTEIKPYVTEITNLSGTDYDINIFTKDEFYKMLVSLEENFGKEAFRKHLLFYGTEAYYEIIKEAAKNGLQSRLSY